MHARTVHTCMHVCELYDFMHSTSLPLSCTLYVHIANVFLIAILKQINLCAISCTYILQTKSHNLYEAAFVEHYENASQIIQ